MGPRASTFRFHSSLTMTSLPLICRATRPPVGMVVRSSTSSYPSAR